MTSNPPTVPTDEELREMAQAYKDKWLLVFEDLQKVRDRTREATLGEALKCCRGAGNGFLYSADNIERSLRELAAKDSHDKQS